MAKRKSKPTPKTKPADRIKLNPRELKFLEEYIRTSNGTQSALKAGYAPRSAHVTASQLLKKPKLRAWLDAHNAELHAATKVTREQLVRELLKIIDTPCTKAPTPAEKAKAIEVVAKMHGFMLDKHEIKTTTDEVVKIYIPHNGRDPIDPKRMCPDPRPGHEEGEVGQAPEPYAPEATASPPPKPEEDTE